MDIKNDSNYAAKIYNLLFSSNILQTYNIYNNINYKKIMNPHTQQIPLQPCFFSSTIFLFNTLFCLYYKEKLYAALFAALTVTSLMYHYQPTNHYFNIADKIAVFTIVTYGGYRFASKHSGQWKTIEIAVLLFFTGTLALFFWPNNFCHDPVTSIANTWHAVLHFLSSIGHILILCI